MCSIGRLGLAIRHEFCMNNAEYEESCSNDTIQVYLLVVGLVSNHKNDMEI